MRTPTILMDPVPVVQSDAKPRKQLHMETAEVANTSNPPSLVKSILNVLNGPEDNSIERLAFEHDPGYTNQYSGLYRAKLKLIPDHLLKRIAIQDDLVACIINARCAQMSAFGRPREDRFSMGFTIEPKAGVFDEASQEQKAEVQKQIDAAVELLSTCGKTRGWDDQERMTFAQWVSQSTRSALVVGRLATEIVYVTDPASGNRTFHSFRPIDAGTIYRAAPQKEAAASVRRQARKLIEQIKNKRFEAERFEADEYAWVQVIEGRPVQAFAPDECLVHNFYSVPDVELDGYPVTPLDTIIAAVTTHLNITNHNKMYFQTGRAARGMLVIKSDEVSPQEIARIKQQFNAAINSSNNAWRMPIFSIAQDDDIQWSPIDSGSRDMEFQYLSDMNARVILSAFSMSPEELPGWSYLSRGTNNQALSESNNEYKLEAHRDVGIRPLIKQFEDFLNERILPLISPRIAKLCVVKLVGLDSETAEKEAVRNQQDMAIHMTMNEVLERVEKKPYPKGWGGDFPLNPQFQAVVDKYLTVGQVQEYFFGVEGASKDPNWAYVRDPFWFNFQQLKQAAQAQQQAQQQAQAAAAQGGQGQSPAQGGGDGGGSPDGGGGGGDGGGQPSGQPSQSQPTEKQASAAQESASASGETELTRGLDQVLDMLTKSEAQLPGPQRRILNQHKKTLDFVMKGLEADAAKVIDEVLGIAERASVKKKR